MAACRSNAGPDTGFAKGAPRERLFCCLLLLGLLPAAPPATAAEPCRGDRPDRRVRVDYVIDGDTVILAGGEHLRLIGIDTPEIDHDGNADEAGARPARRFLTTLIGGSQPLVFDGERRDRHGRLLGHLFTAGGDNIQARLLREGHAVPLVIPPNLRFVDCYHRAAAAARTAARGLWGLPQYHPVDAARLDADTRGYRVVRGTVTRIGESRTSVWINLGRGFALRIVRSDLDGFDDSGFQRLIGRTVEARGDVYRRNEQLRMRLHHPVDLRVLPSNSRNR